MNRFLKSFFFFAVLLSFTFSSCTVGLGEAVDLEAPKITLTYPVIKPGTITYIPRSIELMGTCTDNKKVKAVLVRYSYTLNGTEHSKEENAVIDGEKWSLTISVAYDIDLQVEITASDEGGNTSENSVVSFMACVDAENPEVTEIAVKKNGQQTTLKEKSELAALIESESASKDDLQNEEFSIIASLVDNNGVKSSRLTIFDGDKAILEDLPPDNEGSDNYNQYKPVWTIKASDLEAVDSSYKKGRHYFVPAVSVEDDAGNGKNKECVTYGKYLAWESSTDKPKISFPLASGENKMNIGKGTKIPVVIFDDDGINEVLYSLVPASEYKGSAEATYRENSSLFSKIENISGRDYNFTLNDVSSLGNYFLTVVVKDKKQITGYTSVITYESVETNVTDKNIPIIIISSPEENTSASLSNNKFTISGFCLDDESVVQNGLNTVAVAWLPEGDSQKSSALGLLEKFAKGSEKAAGYSETDSLTGIKIWKPYITEALSKDSEYTDYFKDTFSVEFNVLEDFMSGGNLKNENKYFVIYVLDKSGNAVYKTFRLGAYNTSPSFKIEYASSDTGPYYLFDDAMISYSDESANAKIYFRITPSGYNGIEIDETTLDAKVNQSNITLSPVSGENYFKFSCDVTTGLSLQLEFRVKDKLGNEGSHSCFVSFTDKSGLQSITADVRNGITLAGGESLKIQANFSGTVNVSGNPYIRLGNIKGVSGEQKAVYKTGAGTDTLIFEYIVPSGAYTSSGEYVSTSEGNPITLNGGAVSGDINGTYSSISSCQISIDAVSPKVVVENCSPSLNTKITKGVSTSVVTVAFDENIYSESGTITVRRTTGWAIPPVIDEKTFKEIYAALSDHDRKVLIGTSTGEPELYSNTGTPKGPYKKITQGIKFNSSNAVPDTDTKYVLAFDYDGTELDIFSNSGKVQEIREVLENYGYHKKDFDIGECLIDGKNLKIEIPNDWFVDGRQFEVIIPSGCVRDDVGNVNAEIKSGDYTFWTDKVASPYIIVDRYTHGANVSEPDVNGDLTEIKTHADAFNTSPTGFARARILCETPGASISYGVLSKESKTIAEAKPSSIGDGKTDNINLDDASKSDVENITQDKNYTGIFTLGSAGYEKSGKYYVKASASFAIPTSTQPALSESSTSYEGAYKTVFFCENPTLGNLSETKPLFWQGSCSAGEPSISGFPMRDANADLRYSRALYKVSDSDDNGDYVGISWEIVSSFRMQTFYGNWSRIEDVNCSYGWLIYNNERTYW